jgi:dienelactone hydrolase
MAERATATFQAGPDKYSVVTYAASGSPAKTPAVVLLHGTDGLEGESGTEIPKLAEQIAEAGFIVFVPEYFGRNEPTGVPLDVVFTRRIQSVGTYAPRVAAAVDHACSDPRVDRARLGLVGLSLGGGLALQYALGAAAGTVDAVVDFFGYIDAGSNVYRDAAKLPPTLIFHNENDKIVEPSYSLNLRDALLTHGITHEYHPYDDDYHERRFHPFRPGGRADKDSRSRTVQWLKKYVSAAV